MFSDLNLSRLLHKPGPASTATTSPNVADRLQGIGLGAAVGDALCAPFEAGVVAPPSPQAPLVMLPGGLGSRTAGEWTDDTAMAMALLMTTVAGEDLHTSRGLQVIAAGFGNWFDSSPTDVGIHTARVLASCASYSSDDMCMTSRQLHASSPERSAGNGSLMRTWPVAVAYHAQPQLIALAAESVSELTHADSVCTSACALWSLILHHTVNGHDAQTAAEAAIAELHEPDQSQWRQYLHEARTFEPEHFAPHNGWVVAALQQVWSTVSRLELEQEPSVVVTQAWRQTIQAGHDTDTVATILGSWLGARFGTAPFAEWADHLFGWPGLTGPQLRDILQQVTESHAPAVPLG